MDMREQILRAGAQTVLEKGFDRTSVREIARRAGVAVGTLYLYFPNKDAILDAFVDTLAQDVEAATEAAAEVSSRSSLEKFLAARLDFLLDHRGFVRAVVGRAMFDERVGELVASKLVEPMLKALRTAARRAGLSPQKPTLRLCYSLLLQAALGEPLGLAAPAKSTAAAAAKLLAG